MNAFLVGIDVGGTKTHLWARSLNSSETAQVIRGTEPWRSLSDEQRAAALVGLAGEAVGFRPIAALGVGAHGCDTRRLCDRLQAALVNAASVPTLVVNDAELLGIAAGVRSAINVISGTGSIAVGYGPDAEPMFAGGWGWLLGDEGGASGLVRTAVRACLSEFQMGREPDLLTARLSAAFEVEDVYAVVDQLMIRRPDEWATKASVVFDAASQGSLLAVRVIQEAARSLADLVVQLVERGAEATDVVAGGGVMTHQPRLAEDFTELVRAQLPCCTVRVLQAPPVAGAVELAKRALSS